MFSLVYLKYLYIFLSFVLTFGLMQALARQNNIRIFFEEFGSKLSKKAFPGYSQTTFNLYSLLRIFFAVIILLQAWNASILLLPNERFELVGIIYGVELIAGIFLFFGFFTQYILIFFIGFMWQVGEKITEIPTLGHDISAILALFLILSGAGRNISIDSLILHHAPKLHPYLLYRKCLPSHSALSLYKFAALLSYWLICCYSLGTHLNEEAWMTGVAAPLLLTNNFMSPFHETFSAIFLASPLTVSISRITIYVMMAWYALLLPLVLMGGLFRTFVVTWGVLFFILSTFLLSLGSLGEVEFLLWIALFWPTGWGLKGLKEIHIYYDDKCNLCDKTLRFFCYVDIFNCIETKPLSKNQDQLLKWGISNEQAMTDLYAVDMASNKLTSGYEMYFFMSRRIFCLLPLFPIFGLGYFLNIGPKIYAFIAKRRRALFGVCEIPGKQKNYLSQHASSNINAIEIGVLCHIILLGIIYFITIPTPFFSENPLRKLVPSSLYGAAHVYGIAPINVFNTQDLAMANHWFVLLDGNGDLLPVFNLDGSRGDIHSSDLIYYGYTVVYRREAIGKEGCIFNQHEKKIIYLAEVAQNSIGQTSNLMPLQYIQFYQPSSDFKLLRDLNIFQENNAVVICKKTFTIGSTS